MPITYNGENLTSGITDPQVMFTVVIGLIVIGFMIFAAWALYNIIK